MGLGGSLRSPLHGAGGRYGIVECDEHRLVVGQTVGRGCDRGGLDMSQLLDLHPLFACRARNLVQAAVIDYACQSGLECNLDLVSRFEVECLVARVDYGIAAVQRQAVPLLCRPFGHHLQVLAREVASLAVGRHDGYQRLVILLVEYGLLVGHAGYDLRDRYRTLRLFDRFAALHDMYRGIESGNVQLFADNVEADVRFAIDVGRSHRNGYLCRTIAAHGRYRNPLFACIGLPLAVGRQREGAATFICREIHLLCLRRQ